MSSVSPCFAFSSKVLPAKAEARNSDGGLAPDEKRKDEKS
jgi:hypothetical protein